MAQPDDLADEEVVRFVSVGFQKGNKDRRPPGRTVLLTPTSSGMPSEKVPQQDHRSGWYKGKSMKHRSQGNGSGEFEISQADMGGWVRVYASKPREGREDLAIYLSQTLTEWFRQRPHLRMRIVVPITRNGDTVELHAWFEAHVFPPTSVGPQPSGQGSG